MNGMKLKIQIFLDILVQNKNLDRIQRKLFYWTIELKH